MTRGRRSQDDTTLKMALIGYEIEKHKIEEKIRDVQAALGTGTSTAQAAPKRRKMSASARKRIAAAQKRRWAEIRKKAGKE